MNERLQALGNGISRRVTDFLGTQRPVTLAIHMDNAERASLVLEVASRALQRDGITLDDSLTFPEAIDKYVKVMTEPVKIC